MRREERHSGEGKMGEERAGIKDGKWREGGREGERRGERVPWREKEPERDMREGKTKRGREEEHKREGDKNIRRLAYLEKRRD